MTYDIVGGKNPDDRLVLSHWYVPPAVRTGAIWNPDHMDRNWKNGIDMYLTCTYMLRNVKHVYTWYIPVYTMYVHVFAMWSGFQMTYDTSIKQYRRYDVVYDGVGHTFDVVVTDLRHRR